MQSYLVEGFEGDASELASLIKDMLKETELGKEDVSSFISKDDSFEQKLEQLESIAIDKAKELMRSKQKAAFVFQHEPVSKQSRLLQNQNQTAVAGSQLFINMTPSTLSALFVTLFLIIMLIIGVNCLYNIKTNDKFGKNNLWVGKES